MVTAHGHGNLDVCAQFYQADLPELREGTVAATAAAPAKVRLVSRRVRHVQDGAVDAHQAQVVIEGTQRLRGGKRFDNQLKDLSDGFHSQAMTCLAEVASRGCFVPWLHTTRVFEDLTNRQISKYAHGQHNPEHDTVRQPAGALVSPVRVQQSLFYNRLRDNLTQPRQPIHNGERIRCCVHAASLPRHSRSLLETWVLDTPKVTRGYDLR